MKKVKFILISTILVIAFIVSIVAVNFTFTGRNTLSAAEIAEVRAYSESLRHDRLMESYIKVPSMDENFKDDEITIILDGEHSGAGVSDSHFSGKLKDPFMIFFREIFKGKPLFVKSGFPLTLSRET